MSSPADTYAADPYVTPEDLRRALKLRDTSDPRLTRVCEAVSDAMDWAMGRLDPATFTARPVTGSTGWDGVPVRMDPIPPGISEIALAAAVDWWKMPDAGFGIAGLAETGPVRVPRNIMARFAEQLAPYTLQYGIA